MAVMPVFVATGNGGDRRQMKAPIYAGHSRSGDGSLAEILNQQPARARQMHGRSGRKIVDDINRGARYREPLDQMRADEAAAAGDEENSYSAHRLHLFCL
jgi:hypothetical protein